jgi:hypothetical protein
MAFVSPPDSFLKDDNVVHTAWAMSDSLSSHGFLITKLLFIFSPWVKIWEHVLVSIHGVKTLPFAFPPHPPNPLKLLVI